MKIKMLVGATGSATPLAVSVIKGHARSNPVS